MNDLDFALLGPTLFLTWLWKAIAECAVDAVKATVAQDFLNQGVSLRMRWTKSI